MHIERSPNWILLTLGAILVLGSLVAIPFGGNSSGSQSAGGGASKSTNKVTVKNFAFLPKQATVKVGTKVTWTNEDSATHTATAKDGVDVFTTDDIEQGKSKSVTFDKPGTFQYFCQYHATMLGTVTVE